MLLLLFVTLTTAAEDFVLRGCRAGTPRPQGMVSHRGAPSGQPRQVGGDFYHGERRQLTVLVEFNDRAFKGDEDATKAQWDKIFNVENFTESPFKGSVHDYFLAQSYGNFNIIFDLVYVKVSGNAVKYASDDLADERSQYLVQDIMEVLKTLDINWSLYDWNGDGFINQLLIVYAGHGMNDYYGSDLIWPHQWWMSEHLKDLQEGVYCDPIPVTYGDKLYKVDCYCALAELTKNNDYGSFGTICHEYTHCFGFPDFYYGIGTKTVGSWDLMDSGNYNGYGYMPANYSAHERWLMGWLTPIELKETTEIDNMPALSSEGRAYLIRNDGQENEYYFLENRQRTGWDASLPGSGLVVFHIDYDASIWNSTVTTPNSKTNKRYSIIHANNNNSTIESYTAGWPYPYQANDSLTNTSKPSATLNNPNTDGSKLMNKPIYDMKVENGLASFRFTVPSATAIQERKSEGESKELYRLGPVRIVRDANGTIKKVMKH